MRALVIESIWEPCPKCDNGKAWLGERAGKPTYATCSECGGPGRRLVDHLVVDAKAVQQKCERCSGCGTFTIPNTGRGRCSACSGAGWLPVPPGSYDKVELEKPCCCDNHRLYTAPHDCTLCDGSGRVPLGVEAHVDAKLREDIRRESDMGSAPFSAPYKVDAGIELLVLPDDLFDSIPDGPVVALLSLCENFGRRRE